MRRGNGAVPKLKRAQILLAVDARSTDEAIARNVGAGGEVMRFADDAVSVRCSRGRLGVRRES